jgi:hypothetical protein
MASLAVSVAGGMQQKKANRQDANFLATQQREQALVLRAAGVRQASEEKRQARLLESAIQARAGGGGADPTVVELTQDVAGEGEYRALAALYEGETGALGMERAADAGLRSAAARNRAIDYQMAGTVIGSGASMSSKYGK